MRITAVPLETKFFVKLDERFPKLLEIIRSKGGRVKEQTTGILQILDEVFMNQTVYQSYSLLHVNIFLANACACTK